MKVLALVLTAVAALSVAAPAHATIRYCTGVVDADCFYAGRHCWVYSGFTPAAPLPPLCL